MTIEVACQCGRTLKFPESGAGRKGRCKACGAAFRIPDPVNAIAEPDPGSATPDDNFLSNFTSDDERGPFDVSRIVPDDDEKVVARPAATAAPQPPRVSAGPEPWYYGFLVVYATGTMALGLTVCGLIMAFGFHMAFAAVGKEETKLVPYGLAIGAIGAACVVPVLLASAPIFLAVDAARNLRAIRYSHARGHPGVK
jgi:hypothetical protein